MKWLDLFSGIGGFALGLERAGHDTVAFCEIDPFCRKVLAKHWPGGPIYEDVRTLDAAQIGPVDGICGGFPCQDVSFAGTGAGLSGERSGLWREIVRLVREIRPRYVIVENVAALLIRGMGDVLGDLAGIGFDAEWSVVSACSLGAPHMRRRVFIVAYPHGQHGWQGIWHPNARADGTIQALDGPKGARSGWQARLANPSELYRGAHGLADCMERNRAIGNAVVPQIVEMIGRAINEAEIIRRG
jgi:DNA (cytosine-5)-methyltransferase 1